LLMNTTKKTGHEKNVDNFGILSKHVETLGRAYNPSNALLKAENLVLIGENAKAANTNVNTTEIDQKNARTVRFDAFLNVDPLVTRSLNAFRVSGASNQTIEQAKILVRDVHGQRATDILSEEELVAASKEKGKEVTQNVVHNADFKSKIDSLNKYNFFLDTIPAYNPNEEDLTKDALKTKHTELDTKHTDFVSKHAVYNAALANRKVVLYADVTGLVDIALNVKIYIKSVFGATSDQYKQISGLKFIKYE
jgi:hypothetical protein